MLIGIIAGNQNSTGERISWFHVKNMIYLEMYVPLTNIQLLLVSLRISINPFLYLAAQANLCYQSETKHL